MIPFAEARERILQGVRPISGTEKVRAPEAIGRVLAWPVLAGMDVPNHANSAMDGYAVRSTDLLGDQPARLRVVAELPAGGRPGPTLEAGEAARIMTGAAIPDGCDCVVMQEVVAREGDWVRIPPGQPAGQHIRPAGEDISRGDEILPAGRRLRPGDLGLVTSLGFGHVVVRRRLRVGVLSTGNEVVAVGQGLRPGQVFDSNRTALLTALTALGAEAVDLGLVRDDRKALEEAFTKGAEQVDALISTGGVSVGDYDLVKDVVAQLGEIGFWKVGMKPGKPQAFGMLGEAVFFGLPGNPVSCLAVYLLMARPALLKMMGAEHEPDRLVELPFRGRFEKKHGRRDFLRGAAHLNGADGWVELTGPQGSGILTSMSRANAFILLPEGPAHLKDGDRVTVQLIDYG